TDRPNVQPPSTTTRRLKSTSELELKNPGDVENRCASDASSDARFRSDGTRRQIAAATDAIDRNLLWFTNRIGVQPVKGRTDRSFGVGTEVKASARGLALAGQVDHQHVVVAFPAGKAGEVKQVFAECVSPTGHD